MSRRPRTDEITRDDLLAAKDRHPLEVLVGRHVPLARQGRDFVGLCPFHAERTPSFTVSPEKGFWHCFGCGAHGDQVSFLMHHLQLSFPEAVARLLAEAGLETPEERAAAAERQRRAAAERAEAQRREEAAERARALGIWNATVEPAGTPTETYWREARGLGGLAIPPVIRHHPALKYWHTVKGSGEPQLLGAWPAMVAVIEHPLTRAFLGAHITWIAADGSAKARLPAAGDGKPPKAKKIRGQHLGGVIRLTAPGRVLAVGEGIETTASARAVRPGLAAWCGVSLGNVAGGGLGPSDPHPDLPGKTLPAAAPDPRRPGLVLPDAVKELILLQDGDSEPLFTGRMMRRAALRHAGPGRRVRVAVPPTGLDFNDWLRTDLRGEGG